MLDGGIEIFFAGDGDLVQGFAGRRIDRVSGLRRRDEFTVDDVALELLLRVR